MLSDRSSHYIYICIYLCFFVGMYECFALYVNILAQGGQQCLSPFTDLKFLSLDIFSVGFKENNIDTKKRNLDISTVYMPLPWLVVKDMIPSARKTQLDRNLIKKSVKLALDDLKEKHAGVLLSALALKVNLSLTSRWPL